jgi:hypothetical protein
MTAKGTPRRFSVQRASFALGLVLVIATRYSDQTDAEPPSSTLVPANILGQAEFGTIKGRVIWGGEEAPAPKVLVPMGKASNNPDICAKDAPVFDQALLVDPKTKGVANGLAYLVRPKGGNPAAVEDLVAQHPKVVLDQRNCEFRPYVLPMHQDQTLVIKTSDPMISHNVRMSPFTNPGRNQTLGPGAQLELKLVAERRPFELRCDIHPWMNAWVLVCDHPYFATTGTNGSFEIKGVPAGPQQLVVWHKSGFVTSGQARGMSVEVKAGEAVDVGEIKLDPKKIGL